MKCQDTTGKAASDAFDPEDVLQLVRSRWPAAIPMLARACPGSKSRVRVFVDAQGVQAADVATGLADLFGCDVSRRDSVWVCGGHLAMDVVRVYTYERGATSDYFAWGGAGVLLDGVARTLGFELDHTGLRYVVKNGERQITVLTVSRDMPEVFRFLGYADAGYNHARYTRGFNTREAGVFNFVSASKYFDRAAFATAMPQSPLEADGELTRAFLDWCEKYKVASGTAAGMAAAFHLARAKLMFPRFAMRLASELARVQPGSTRGISVRGPTCAAVNDHRSKDGSTHVSRVLNRLGGAMAVAVRPRQPVTTEPGGMSRTRELIAQRKRADPSSLDLRPAMYRLWHAWPPDLRLH